MSRRAEIILVDGAARASRSASAGPARRCPSVRIFVATARIVRTNREHPPDYIIMKVEELTGGRPFRHIDDVISQEELRELSESYKRIAGFALPSTRNTP